MSLAEICYTDAVASLELVLIGLLAIMLALQLSAVLRSKPEKGQDLHTSLVQIDARLDEQGRRQHEQAQALRTEIEQRLSDGFDRTSQTYTDMVKRLALIDQAQQKITELSSNVVSLQEVLADRTSRGTFGEVQLEALVRNILPPGSYAMQHTLSNGRRADCMLFLPHPTGNVAIDSKFPLSNYRRKVDASLAQVERQQAGREFARDVRTHIEDVASRYILPDETCDAAILFLPAEAVFAEIHAAYPELVETAQQKRVWLTSPTTLMAVLTTARSVLKDAATREEVHAIQNHLRALGQDFDRFETRMDKLSNHIRQAGHDVQQVQTSARKIASRFKRIDRVDLGSPNGGAPPESASQLTAAGALESPGRQS